VHLLWRWVLPTRRSVQTACWAQWTSDTAWSRPVSWCLQARNTSFSPRTCLCSWCLLQVSFAKHCLSSFDPVASCIQYYIIRYHDIMRMCARCQLSRGVDSCCQPCACFLSSLVISRFPLGWLLQAGHKLFWFFGDSRIGLSYLGRWVAKDVWEALGQWNQRLGFVERFLRHSMIFNDPMATKKQHTTFLPYLKIQDLDRKVRAVIRYLPSTMLFFFNDVYYIFTGCLCCARFQLRHCSMWEEQGLASGSQALGGDFWHLGTSVESLIWHKFTDFLKN